MKLCCVGGGKMAEALIRGLIASSWAPIEDLGIIEIAESRRAYLGEQFPGLALASSCAEALADARFDVTDVLIAVKPQHLVEVAGELGAGGAQRALSIAAGVRIETILDAIGSHARVIRSMPNTPALIGQGAAAIAASADCSTSDLDWAHGILSAVGSVVTVDEADLDAVTAVSGSGPAYVFLLAEAMTAAGVAQGLSPQVADELTRQTLLGASTLLATSGDEPAQLRANVTSPGGTTAAAIAAMQSQGIEAVIGAGIEAATARSRELGGS